MGEIAFEKSLQEKSLSEQTLWEICFQGTRMLRNRNTGWPLVRSAKPTRLLRSSPTGVTRARTPFQQPTGLARTSHIEVAPSCVGSAHCELAPTVAQSTVLVKA